MYNNTGQNEFIECLSNKENECNEEYMIKVIAEIGWNHMGDMDLAEKMIISAAECGVDYCKFQTWSESNLKDGAWDGDGRREIYKKAQLSQEEHFFLQRVCDENSVKFMTSIFNISDLDFLKNMNMDVIKIPSHEVNNIELIKATLKEIDTVLVSTGASKWSEVNKIMNISDKNRLVLMHCVSSYPCPPEKVNLPRIKKLKEISGNNVGYSGHYFGISDAIAAICHGVTIVEKHFTVDHELPGRDNKFAILPDKMAALCNFRDT